MATIRKFVARVDSGNEWACPWCDDVCFSGTQFLESCNHLLHIHNVECVHIGEETVGEQTGIFHSTVATFAATSRKPGRKQDEDIILEVPKGVRKDELLKESDDR